MFALKIKYTTCNVNHQIERFTVCDVIYSDHPIAFSDIEIMINKKDPLAGDLEVISDNPYEARKQFVYHFDNQKEWRTRTELQNKIAHSIRSGKWRTLHEHLAGSGEIDEDVFWISEIRKLLSEYEENNPTGGSLHIVLDDRNIHDTDIAFCNGYACAEEDKLGSEIGNLMSLMNIRQRVLTLKIWDHTYPINDILGASQS